MPALTRTVASLALVKFSWDHLKQDHLDAFVPFVATLLKAGRYEAIFDEDVHRLCRDCTVTFGFEIPYHPMIALLNRAKKRGLLRRLQGRFVPVAANIRGYAPTQQASRKET